MNSYLWYQTLLRPSWAPPSWIFAPVWTVLYILIAISFGFVFYRIIKGYLDKKTAVPFILNLIFNLLFTPIQFGLKNNVLAMFDILAVLITLIWILCSMKDKIKWVAWVNVPYLLWVAFATVLQINVTILNL